MRTLAATVLPLAALSPLAQAAITTPRAYLGFDVCADYQLADYGQLTGYWRRLAKESNRIRIVEIGKTEFGRPQLMAIVSDSANLRELERHRRTSERFARAGFRDEPEAIRAAKTAKPVVWIDGGLHANETLGAQQLIEAAYRLVGGEDEETRRIRRDVVTLLVQANPDGMDLVSRWYMRRKDPAKRSLAGLPDLYERYAGHDNNRDFYAMNLAETRNMSRVLYREWFPQIVYNHHQSAPRGTIMYVPPFRNPFNHNVDALVQNSTDLVGTLIQNRLIGEGRGGTVSRDEASFSSWWNGGLRTAAYFHNAVGILTETWGSPNPAPIPFLKNRQVPLADLPLPIEPRMWHQRDSLEYELTANWAILDHASRYRERLLLGAYRAARNSIERGRRDSWTRTPSKVEQFGEDAIRRPELRDARAYVLPYYSADQGAVRLFLDRLEAAGIDVEHAIGDGPGYRDGDYVIRCDVPFRPYILDMFEPQDHPNDFRYPGGPPIPPYDSAGYTLAYQMGVPFTRIVDGKDVPKTRAHITRFRTNMRKRVVIPAGQTEGYTVAARWLTAGKTVERGSDGSFRVESGAVYGPLLDLTVGGEDLPDPKPIRLPKIALLDVYGGSIPSGWTRWLLDYVSLPYTVVYPATIKRDGLNGFDVLLAPSGTVSPTSEKATPFPYADDPTVPAELAQRWGPYTSAKTGAAIRRFVQAGGHVVGWGAGTDDLASALELPVVSAMKGVKRDDFYIPGSVLRTGLRPSPLTRGMGETLDVIFDDSPVFAVAPEGQAAIVAGWDEAKPLRSGWAWGQERLKGNAAIVDFPVGKGRAVLSGPELNFRGQSYASFRILLAAIFRAAES